MWHSYKEDWKKNWRKEAVLRKSPEPGQAICLALKAPLRRSRMYAIASKGSVSGSLANFSRDGVRLGFEGGRRVTTELKPLKFLEKKPPSPTPSIISGGVYGSEVPSPTDTRMIS